MRDHKSRRVPSKYQISTNTTPRTLGFYHYASFCVVVVALPSKCNHLTLFMFFARQFIYQETAAVNDRKSTTIYWQVVNGAGGLRTKPGVLAGPVKDYKALVVAHDLFMAGWHTVVWGSWSLHSSRLLLHKQQMVMENK